MSNKDFNLADEFKAYDKMWEWIDKSGKNVSLNQAPATNTKTSSQQYYMWSMYIPNSLEYPKGNWTSADLNHKGEIEGVVFATEDLALDYGWDHLKELEDEDELEGFEPDDFTIEAIAVSGNKFGPYTDLIEWLDAKGNQVHINKTTTNSISKQTTTKAQTTSTKSSQPPVVAKNVMRRKPVKDKFGLLVPNWQPEFIKLGLHIWETTKKPADEKDSGVGPTILRIYFEMPNGEEWRLEVTNTKHALAKGLGLTVDEDWDYAISAYRNGREVVVQRGKTKDYNEFLDILLGLGIIADKRKCV